MRSGDNRSGESREGVRAVLSRPRAYSMTQRLLRGSSNPREAWVHEDLCPRRGDRVLDIGCGTGETAMFMPDGVSYVGFDLNPAYIESARKRFGYRGEFHCMNVSDAELTGASFDMISARGILHHLSDAEADSLFRLAATLLAPGGRVITADQAAEAAESRLVRLMHRLDRGKEIRRSDEYADLAKRRFGSVSIRIRRDPLRPPLLRMPYPLATVEASDPL